MTNNLGEYETSPTHHSGETLSTAASRWNTPTEGNSRGNKTRDDGSALLPGQAAQWMTPRATEGEKASPNSRDSAGSVHLTPLARDGKGRTNDSRSAPSLPDQIARPSSGPTGFLNPAFVEALMGLPIGWTDCEPAEMGLFRRRRR